MNNDKTDSTSSLSNTSFLDSFSPEVREQIQNSNILVPIEGSTGDILPTLEVMNLLYSSLGITSTLAIPNDIQFLELAKSNAEQGVHVVPLSDDSMVEILVGFQPKNTPELMRKKIGDIKDLIPGVIQGMQQLMQASQYDLVVTNQFTHMLTYLSLRASGLPVIIIDQMNFNDSGVTSFPSQLTKENNPSRYGKTSGTVNALFNLFLAPTVQQHTGGRHFPLENVVKTIFGKDTIHYNEVLGRIYGILQQTTADGVPMVLEEEDNVFLVPKAAVSVGDPVSPELEEFLSGNEEVLIVSLGSVMPPDVDLFLESLRTFAASIPEKVVLIDALEQWDEIISRMNIPNNLYVNSGYVNYDHLLSYPQVRYVLGAGGSGSTWNAVSHGKIVGAIPMQPEQESNYLRAMQNPLVQKLLVNPVDRDDMSPELFHSVLQQMKGKSEQIGDTENIANQIVSVDKAIDVMASLIVQVYAQYLSEHES